MNNKFSLAVSSAEQSQKRRCCDCYNGGGLFTCLDLPERARTDTRFHARRVEAGAMNAIAIDTALEFNQLLNRRRTDGRAGFWSRRGVGGTRLGCAARGLSDRKVEG